MQIPHIKLSNKVIIFIYIIIIISGLFLRVLYLDSDPPSILSPSAAIYADEGYKALNARNTVLFGTPTPVEYDQYPGHTNKWVIYNIQIWLFSTFGVSLQVLRIAHIFITIIISVIWFFFGMQEETQRFKLLFLAVLAFNPFFLFFSRIALFEIPMVFIWILSLLPFQLVLQKYNQWNKTIYFYIFLFSILYFIGLSPFGMAIKKSYLIMIVSTLVAFIGVFSFFNNKIYHIIQKIISKNYFPLLLIFTLLIIYIYLILFQPSRAIIGRDVVKPVVLINKVFSNSYLRLQPLSLILAFGSAFGIIRKVFKYEIPDDKKRKNSFALFTAIFFITGYTIIWLFPYDPPRYYLIIIFPQMYLTSYSLKFLVTDNDVFIKNIFQKKPVLSWIVIIYSLYQILMWAKSVLVISKVWIFVKNKFIIGLFTSYIPINIIKIILVISLLLVVSAIIIRKGISNVGNKIIIILFISFVLFYSNFLIFRTNELQNVKQYLSTVLEPEEIIAGDWAPRIVFDLPIRAIYISSKYWNYSNLDNMKPDYIMANYHYNDADILNKYLPESKQLRKGNEAYRFKLSNHDVGIWKVTW